MKWTEHPILKPPTPEEAAKLSDEEILQLYEAHEAAIYASQVDPLNYGFELECWKDADELLEKHDMVVCFGGNRSAKSTFGARTVVKAALENPNSFIICFAQDHDASVRIQQRYVYEYLPPEMRSGMKSETAYSKFTLKNGFTGGGLIFPNGSEIHFHAYSQFTANRAKFEGLELGSKKANWVNVGLWADEYLGDGALIETMRFRLATRDAKMIITFTPIDGYTSFVADLLKTSETTKTRKAELLDDEPVPYIQENSDRATGIIYFHSEFNPFGGYDRLRREVKGRKREEILTRLYGVPVKSLASVFPLFNRLVNVLDDENMPDITGKGYTRYQIIDPAGGKNWFMVWVAIDETDTWYVYREWPDVSYGDWAEASKEKWVPGPAAKGTGKGIMDYVGMSKDLEKGEDIMERLIDPRLGSARYQGTFGASSIIEDLCNQGMVCNPAMGLDIDDGIQALNNLMSYDPEKPIDSANRPRFFISEHCENTIRALQEYTASGGKDEAWKDPCDCLRYGAISDIRHIPADALKTTRNRKGGY